MYEYPFPIAAPSWVLPGNAKDNIIFLNNKVEEIELLCFEPSFPQINDFPDINVTWHLHLPTSVPIDFFQKKEKYKDLPSLHEEDTQWGNPWVLAQNLEDIDFYTSCCVRIFEHCKKLEPWTSVVHLPPTQSSHAKEKLIEFIEYWQAHLPLNALSLENVRDATHQEYKNILCQENYKDLQLCLDIAHTITYEQKAILDHDELMSKVALVHWSSPYPAPCLSSDCSSSSLSDLSLSAGINSEQMAAIKKQNKNKDMHLALHHLKDEFEFCQRAMNEIPENAVHVIEVFSWQGIEDSMDFFNTLITGKKLQSTTARP